MLASVDFTTIDAWTRSGLVTYYLLFFMELATRRAHFAGPTANPDAGPGPDLHDHPADDVVPNGPIEPVAE